MMSKQKLNALGKFRTVGYLQKAVIESDFCCLDYDRRIIFNWSITYICRVFWWEAAILVKFLFDTL